MDENNNRPEAALAEQSEGSAAAGKNNTAGKKRKGHGGAFFLGLLIVAFAVFGVYTAVSMGVEKINAVADNSAKIAEYEKFLEPFVVIDPSPFDDVSTAEPTDLLDAAISALIYNSDKLNTYEVYEGEITGLLVPQEDVEEYFIKMFGKEVKLVHADVADSFYGVMYNSEKKSYIIPITSINPIYTPKVFSVEKKGSSIILTVGYIGGSEWAQLERGQYTAPEPSKFMKITLREDENGYHIGSLQATAAEEVAQPEETVTTTARPETSPPSASAAGTETQTDDESGVTEDESGTDEDVSDTESTEENED